MNDGEIMIGDIGKAVEAILFATGESVSYDKLASVFSLTPGQIKNIVSDMSQNYGERGIRLLCYDNACQLCTKEEYEGVIKDALGIKKNGALSNSSLETLAVIAYNQPVTRAYVDEVRGVDSSYAFSVLTQRELIEVKGKLDVPGRPNLYVTTKNFLRVFGLSSLAELPKVSLFEAPETAEEGSGADTDNGTETQTLKEGGEAEATPTPDGDGAQ